MWLSCIKKDEENLLKMIKEKNITGKDIKLIVDVFMPLIAGLKIKNVGKNEINDEDKKEKKVKENISSRWKEVAPFSRETFYLGAETVLIKSKVPEVGVSDLPFGDFKGEPSSLDVFQRMPPDFYEPLDKAFESASFENIEDIRKVSQEKAVKLEEDDTLRQLGMSKEEAEVLFSYTYEAKEGKTPCYTMNKILYEHDDDKLRGHRGYILHLLKALRRLKPVLAAGTTLYRGIDGKFLGLGYEYNVGNILTWPAFTSTSIKESVAYSFIKMINAEKPIIFEIRGDFVGYSIKTFSNFPKEEEVLLEPETTFRVVSIQDDTKDPKAKRIVVDVKSTPLMIKEAVENFGKTERCLQHSGQQQINKEKLPPEWKEVVSPSGETSYFNTKTGISLPEAPETGVSDLPFGDFVGKPSALDIFQRMPPSFYEPLDKAFESASFDGIEDIKRKTQKLAAELEKDGTLEQLGMSREEAGVIYSYTYGAMDWEKSPCCIINKILADHDAEKLKKYRGYILHLLKALRRLKPIPTNGITLYRGVNANSKRFDEKHYKVGNILTLPAFTSTTVKDVVTYFFMRSDSQPIIFEIRGAFVGYRISLFSNFPKEEEILLEPETTFKVVSIENDAKNPKAKRIKLEVQPTPLMIKDAVENFAKAEWNLQHPQQQMNYGHSNSPDQSSNQQQFNPGLSQNNQQNLNNIPFFNNNNDDDDDDNNNNNNNNATSFYHQAGFTRHTQ